MDGYEATRIVFSRIQNLDPENASKITGLLLLHDHGEKELIRLAFGPEALLHSLILKARKELGILPNSPSTPSSPSPFLARQNSSSSSSRLNIGSHNHSPPHLTIPNCTSWSTGSGATDLPAPDDLNAPPNSTSMNPSALPFYVNGSASSDIIDDFQLHDQLSFLNESSSNLGNNGQDLFYQSHVDVPSSPPIDSMLFPSYWKGGGGSSVHRRSCSVNDVFDSSDDLRVGIGWRPCLYFARGYCKNGSSCRFVHGGETGSQNLMGSDGTATLVSPHSKIDTIDQCHELLRSKSAAAAQAHRQRLAATSQLMGSSSFPYSPKSVNLLPQQQQNDAQRASAAAFMLNEDLCKFGRSRLEKGDFSINGSAGILNPASRQIYLTFPADSTFREEDVSNYFSTFGPVQDVRIPYQQKRMFGFVTFVYPETVKMILAKGNPHFVCDARVLVKPYKEKGKVADGYRKQLQQVERGEFSPCSTPTGLASRDPFDLHLGARMLYDKGLLWRRKMEEQADLQQALELQSRRLIGLQLLDVKKHHHHRALSACSPIPSPSHSPNIFHQNLLFPPLHSNSAEPLQENVPSSSPTFSVAAAEKQVAKVGESIRSEENINRKDASLDGNSDGPAEKLEHNLPDSPFASPTKGTGEYFSAFSNNAGGTAKEPPPLGTNNNMVSSNLTNANASPDMASFKSLNCQMTRKIMKTNQTENTHQTVENHHPPPLLCPHQSCHPGNYRILLHYRFA